MASKITLKFVLNILLILPVYTLRISPKLDFGEPNTDRLVLNAGVRPNVNPKLNYRIENGETKLDTVTVTCASGNCNTTKTKTQNEHGISTDVLVHIKTNVDTDKVKNETTATVIPDVPVVIGTKTNTVSTNINNRPQFPLLYSSVNSNYPIINFLAPLSTNNPLELSGRPNFMQNRELRGNSQTAGFYEYNSYAPRFQDKGSGIELQSGYSQPALNFRNDNPATPSSSGYSRQSGLGGYNPVEFRKTYRNTWASGKWYGGSSFNSERRIGNTIPRWSSSCVCQRPDGHYYPTTSQNGQSSYPSRVNDKLASLN